MVSKEQIVNLRFSNYIINSLGRFLIRKSKLMKNGLKIYQNEVFKKI